MLSRNGEVTCGDCHGKIRWAINANGNRQAIDAEPNEAGNLGAYTDGVGTLRIRVLTKERPTLEHTEWRAMPHHKTCQERQPLPRALRTSRRPGRRAPVVRNQDWQRRWTR